MGPQGMRICYHTSPSQWLLLPLPGSCCESTGYSGHWEPLTQDQVLEEAAVGGRMRGVTAWVGASTSQHCHCTKSRSRVHTGHTAWVQGAASWQGYFCLQSSSIEETPHCALTRADIAVKGS